MCGPLNRPSPSVQEVYILLPFFFFFKVVYRKQRQCCVTCGEQGSVSLTCGHGLQCESCSASTECPLCPEQTQEQQLS